ncbi:MAG: hypothetical protein M1167_02350 [Chloroflexi bacterium]|nr:hypothetical protein [Chloroflexota bacterium]
MTVSAKKKMRPSVFQVLLLDNDASDDVEVQEGKQVDFSHVKEHLKHGGSVFITSKSSQKLAYPKAKAQHNYSKTRRNYGTIFRQHQRKP